MVTVTGLTKRFGENTAVDHISFTLQPGQIYGLLGPNGAGKSTTLKMLTGCFFPTEGSITIDGHDLFQEPEAAKRCIGYLPEIPPLYPSMTPREYLSFMAEIKEIPKGERKRCVDEVVEKTRIGQMQDRLIRHLSKGYTQRVGIAQALLGMPPLLILDEPMVGLDPTQIVEMRSLVKELGKSHTIIFSSHILSEVSMLCSQVLIIDQGKLIANDRADNLQPYAKRQDLLSVTIGCLAEEAQAVLQGIAQVERMEISPDGEGQCTALLYHAKGADVQGEVFTRLHGAGYKIIQMGARSASLEDVFLSLLDRDKKKSKQPSRRKGGGKQ